MVGSGDCLVSDLPSEAAGYAWLDEQVREGNIESREGYVVERQG